MIENLTIIDTTIAVAILWLWAVVLLALNDIIIGMSTGRGRFHPMRWRRAHYVRLFQREVAPTLALQAEIDSARRKGSEPAIPEDFAGRLRCAVTQFPDQERWVMPTKFGNIMRAFEIYPRVVYGLDGVPAWSHLQSVLPEQASTIIAAAKAQLDFALNRKLVASVVILFHVVLAVTSLINHMLPLRNLAVAPNPQIVIVSTLVYIMSHAMLLNAAFKYGSEMAAAFNLYRAKLAKELGLIVPKTMAKERDMWVAVSRMMIYRSSAQADYLTRYRADYGTNKEEPERQGIIEDS